MKLMMAAGPSLEAGASPVLGGTIIARTVRAGIAA